MVIYIVSETSGAIWMLIYNVSETSGVIWMVIYTVSETSGAIVAVFTLFPKRVGSYGRYLRCFRNVLGGIWGSGLLGLPKYSQLGTPPSSQICSEEVNFAW